MMKAEDLKNSVLQMAMQGKLVPQNPGVEPATKLLEKIKQKKEQLIKDKVLYDKTKPSLIIKENDEYLEVKGRKKENVSEEILFEIPSSWAYVRISSINDIYTGNSINKTEKENKYTGISDGYNYIATKDVKFNNQIDYENGVKIPKNIEKFKKAPKNSILLCIEGGSAGRKIGFTKEKVCFGNKLCCFNNLGLYDKFLFYYLQSPQFKEVFKSEISGIIGGVGVGKIRKMIISCPPYEEQKRIVEKLEQILPQIEQYGKYEEQLTKLNQEFPEKLKKSILQQAIQGKLVPQNPNDEPASTLLKKIKQEKEQLIKEGKIKRNKNESTIYKKDGHWYEVIDMNNEVKCIDDEIPFEIPKSWLFIRLGTIGDWKAGSTPKRGENKYYSDGTIPWLKTGDLNDSYINEIPENITELALKETSVRLNPTGSVLMAMYGATIGKLGILNIEATTNQACCACIPFKGISSEFLLYYLMAERQNFINMGEGGAQPNISRTKIINKLMILPTENEQKRIVEKLDQILPQIEQFRKY